MTFAYGTGARFSVVVDGFDDEGRGRGHFEGADVAVRGAAPGDVCVVRTERAFKARQLIQARVESYQTEGPIHVQRHCAHPGPCPACPFEGLSRSFEVGAKMARVHHAVSEAGLDPGLVDDLVFGPRHGRRQKVKLTAQGGPGPLTLGMYVPHTHVLAPATGCPYAEPDLAEVGDEIQMTLRAHRAWADDERRPGIKGVILRAYPEGVAAAVVTRAPLDDAVWADLCTLDLLRLEEWVDAAQGNSLVGGQMHRAAGPPHTAHDGGTRTAISPHAFCQPDPDLAQRLYDDVAAHLVALGAGHHFDLYAGEGGFARALGARGVHDVVGVETAPAAFAILQTVCREAVMQPVEEFVQSRPLPAGAAVIADPPRKGLGPVVTGALARAHVRALALVSCDLGAFTRDAAELSRHGFVPVVVRPYDFFPGTPQVELLSLWGPG